MESEVCTGHARSERIQESPPDPEAKRETTGSPAKLALIADRKEISADGRDLSVVQVQVLDAQNRLVPIAGSPIEFHLSGNGSLLGVGNGNPSSHEADKADRRHAFNV